jgi:SAM-dependent methyltransferase
VSGSEEFSDPRLVELYDLLNPPGPDTEFFLSLPRHEDRAVLDVGCGTGLLAVDYARRGLDTAGVDPAAAMLQLARNRPGGDRVLWIEASASTFAAARQFDLATMTSHVFQFFLTADEVAAALRNIRRHLIGGGRLAFDTRNPHAAAWSKWTRPATERTVVHPRLGPVTTGVQVTDHADDLIYFEIHYRFHSDGARAVSHNTLRFTPAGEVISQLEAAGYSIIDLYGDWDRSPLDPASPEIIIVAAPSA